MEQNPMYEYMCLLFDEDIITRGSMMTQITRGSMMTYITRGSMMTQITRRSIMKKYITLGSMKSKTELSNPHILAKLCIVFEWLLQVKTTVRRFISLLLESIDLSLGI